MVACTPERILFLEQGLPLTEINIKINIKKVIHAVVNAVHKYYTLITMASLQFTQAQGL